MKSAKITLAIQEGLLPDREITFGEPRRCVIGRAEDCDIQLPVLGLGMHRNVSRHHCQLDIDPPAVRVRDLGSRNGTFVNGHKIGQRAALDLDDEPPVQQPTPAHELKDGDELRVGDAVFRVQVSEVEEKALPWFPLLFV